MASTIIGAHQRCDGCGFDPDHLAPSDAAVAARSLARRWRQLLDAVAEREDDDDALLHQRLASGWSPLERLSHVVDVFEDKAQRLMRVWETERPVLDEDGINAGRASAATGDRADLVAQLAAAGAQLATVIDRYEGEEWQRTGMRAGHPVTAWQLAAEAIHGASLHLRACRDDLTAVCTHPLDDDEEET